MARVEHSIQVEVPAGMAYAQWSRPEEFHAFMEGVTDVRRLSDRRWLWTIEAPERKRWYTHIRQSPGRFIAWKGEGESLFSGIVTFREAGVDQTEVRLRLAYEPEGIVGEMDDALGAVVRHVEGDLGRFKSFMEARSTEPPARHNPAVAAVIRPRLHHAVPIETAMAHCADYETRGRFGASGQGGSGYGGTSEGSTSPGTPGLPSMGPRT
jgi:hypothetical protein